MFMQPDTVPGKLDEGFSRPVESIMRCEDFKSNFARKLSNRFISRHVPTPRQDNSLKLCLDEKAQDAQESFEANQLSKFVAEPNCETVKPPDRQTTSSDIRSTKVNALNMEVETLRWQLAQTEANRQMHIALLRQVVTFLSRVKEHIEGQKTEGETEATRMNRSFNVTDLPRSRSVLHVNKNLEYTLSPVKKINSRKISKSISNVNGYKDCNVWSQSKMALTSETETAFKLSEEMSRLIILANTVLSTKLPDLACNCNDNEVNESKQTEDNEEICEKESKVSIISYGATITSIQVPDKKGVPDDVVAGFDTLEEYFQPRNPYFGATIGRYANIIRDATMVVRPSGRMYMLSNNKGHHHYHGGYVGFDKVNWHSYVNGNQVIMSHVSERFHEGYPGTVMAQITFEVTCDNTLKIEMKCTSSEPTIVNLSCTPYFNLAGHHSGNNTMYDHIFTINADKYTAADDDGVVTGEKKVVGGTIFDFRVPRVLRTMLPRVAMGGYDINYCVTQGTAQDLTFHARALHPVTGRVMELYSNQPGLQFYTGNLLPDPDKIVETPVKAAEEEEAESTKSESGDSTASDKSSVAGEVVNEEESVEGKTSVGYVPLMGKQGTFYKKHGLFCLMPQNYPDAVNHTNFPNSVLNPGEVYVHRIQYKFGILLGRYI